MVRAKSAGICTNTGDEFSGAPPHYWVSNTCNDPKGGHRRSQDLKKDLGEIDQDCDGDPEKFAVRCCADQSLCSVGTDLDALISKHPSASPTPVEIFAENTCFFRSSALQCAQLRPGPDPHFRWVLSAVS